MMKVPPPSSATRGAYDAIVALLETRGAEGGAMFGMPSIKAGGKGFAGLFGDAMVFKLRGDAHAKALALKGAALFDPSGMGRPMKEWVVVPSAHAKRWSIFAEEALESASNAAPTAKKAPAPKKKTTPSASKKSTKATSSASKRSAAKPSSSRSRAK